MLYGLSISQCLAQKHLRCSDLRFRHFYIAKYMILKALQELTYPDLLQHHFAVATIEPGCHY